MKILRLEAQDGFFPQKYYVIKVHNQYNKDNVHHQHLSYRIKISRVVPNSDESEKATKPTLALSRVVPNSDESKRATKPTLALF
jgi:hypothetical protein